MSAQKASVPARFAAAAAATALVAVAAAVAVRLAGRREVPLPPRPAPPPEGRVVDVKERVRHEEFDAGRLVAEIRGDAFSRGADGLNRLAGSVEAVHYGPDGAAVSRLTAAEIAYAPGSRRFTVRGGVRVEAGGVVLEGESFGYDQAAGLFRTNEGGRFATGTMSGAAPEISYDASADEVRLGGGFEFRIPAEGAAGGTVAVFGEALTYARRDRRGRVEGKARIEGAGLRAAAAAGSFVASPDGPSLESAVLEGAAEAVFGGPEPAADGSGAVRAGRIALTFSRALSGLAMASSGGCRLEFRPAADGLATVRAPEVLLNIVAGGPGPTWEAWGGVQAEIADAGRPLRTIEGERLRVDGARTLHASGRSGGAAVADSAEARIEAPSISVRAGGAGLDASGGVTGVLRRGGGERGIGFFAPSEDVAIASRTLELRSGTSLVLLNAEAVMSQGPNSLSAAVIEIAGEAGRMSGGGGVKASLAEGSGAAGRARPIELGGRTMAYARDSGKVTFSEKAYVRLPEARLEADSVSAAIGREDGAVESLSAAGRVVVTKGEYTARADAASYDPGAGLLVLAGNAVLTDGKGSASRGGKLTFDLADDKILVENEGTGRSTAVIKS